MTQHPWKFRTEEVSANALFHTGVRKNGASVEFTEMGENIARLLSEAVSVELKLTPSPAVALYAVLSSYFGRLIQNYEERAFGSWLIEGKSHRLVFDGKDRWFIFQKKEIDWIDDEIVELDRNYTPNQTSKIVSLALKYLSNKIN